MSISPKYYTPEGSNELFDSETGELLYSAQETIWFDDQFDIIKKETYKNNAYRDLENYRKLKGHVDSLIQSGVTIEIKKPPPPSPEFLPKAYYRPPPEDMSKYTDFEDYVQKNMNRYNF